MTKNQIRQRLIDIHAGAGRRWIEEYQYFEIEGTEALQRAMFAVRDSLLEGKFDDHWLFQIYGLDTWGDMDGLVVTVHELVNRSKGDE